MTMEQQSEDNSARNIFKKQKKTKQKLFLFFKQSMFFWSVPKIYYETKSRLIFSTLITVYIAITYRVPTCARYSSSWLVYGNSFNSRQL